MMAEPEDTGNYCTRVPESGETITQIILEPSDPLLDIEI